MDDLIPIVAILSGVGTICAIIVVPTYLKFREKSEMQKTIRSSVDRGETLPAELVDALTRDVRRQLPSRSGDLRKGVICVAVGIGMALFGLFANGGIHRPEMFFVAVGCVPSMIGVAFIVLSFFNPNKE